METPRTWAWSVKANKIIRIPRSIFCGSRWSQKRVRKLFRFGGPSWPVLYIHRKRTSYIYRERRNSEAAGPGLLEGQPSRADSRGRDSRLATRATIRDCAPRPTLDFWPSPPLTASTNRANTQFTSRSTAAIAILKAEAGGRGPVRGTQGRVQRPCRVSWYHRALFRG